MMVCAPRDDQETEKILGALVHSQTTPTAIELLGGREWAKEPALSQFSPSHRASPLFMAVALEGTDQEVRWMTERLGREWWEQGVAEQYTLFDGDADALMKSCIEFPAANNSPLIVKGSIIPSGVTSFMAAVRKIDPQCAILAHAGNGIVIARLSQAPIGGVTKGLIGILQSAAGLAQGSVVVLGGTNASELTHRGVWGTPSSPQALMTAVKREFDPKNLLNPDRFVYAGY
jgi:hypothetical protein